MRHPVLELELRRCAALAAGDFAEVEALTSPRLVYVHAPGVVHGREELMRFLRKDVQFSSVERRDLKLRARGGVAWTTGLLRYEGWRLPAREPFVAFSFVTQIWCRVDERWQMEVCHSTKVTEDMWRGAAGAVDSPTGSETAIQMPT
jgi:Domain of unknown function (DUF4440)